jgi:hypothetical protein
LKIQKNWTCKKDYENVACDPSSCAFTLGFGTMFQRIQNQDGLWTHISTINRDDIEEIEICEMHYLLRNDSIEQILWVWKGNN